MNYAGLHLKGMGAGPSMACEERANDEASDGPLTTRTHSTRDEAR